VTKAFTTCLVLLILLCLQRLEAQSPPAGGKPGTAAEQKPPVEDPLGRSTPLGTTIGLLMAVEEENLDRAGEYLESALKFGEKEELARKLGVVLDRKLVARASRLSREPGGDIADGLTNRDRIGVVESPLGDVEIFLDRVQRGQADPIWLFSSSTLREIPRLYDEIQPPWIEQYVPAPLRTTGWLAIPLYRWIAIALLIPLIFGLAGLSTRALSLWLGPVLGRLSPGRDSHKVISVGAVRLLVLAAFFYAGSFFGFSLATRHFWQRVAETVMVIALCWLSLRVMDLVAELSLTRLNRINRSGDVALVRLINRLLKAATVIVSVLFLLYLSDVDLTAALTGLGVGGIAIGFGAQKTIENLFGGIMVISDKPVNVGDACKVGEFVGTVEDIGIRSTRIRTLDRTVVSVPNGQLAAMILENFAQRDRFRFYHTVGLGGQTTTGQLRDVLAQIRRVLEAHPRVEVASARARFIKVSGASLDLEIFAYVLEREHPAFLAIQEDLLLAIMDIIDRSGASLAVPFVAAPPAMVAR
jgi:MscS family membrane protein